MDSSTITGSPAATESPGLLVIWKTTPVMWALTSSGIEGSFLPHLSRVRPFANPRARHAAPVEGDARPQPLHYERLERVLHAGDRLVARSAGRHELGEQRVVVYRNLAA